MVWSLLGPVSWAVAVAICVWLVGDFLRTNRQYSEDALLSSREGVDELFSSQAQAPGDEL